MRKFLVIGVFLVVVCMPKMTNAAMINLSAYLKIKINAIGGDDMFTFSLKPEYYNSWDDYDFSVPTSNGYAENDQEVIYSIQYHYLNYQTPPGWELVSHNCTSNNPYNTFVDCLRGVQIRMIDFTYATCEYTFRKKQTRNPVLIIPGIMGSYLKRASDGKELWPNIDEMLLPGEDGFLYELEMDENGISKNNIKTGDIVRKPVGADVYDGLIKELENAGYKENTDLFILPYDWRQDIAISADVTLKNKIDELKNLTGKVDVVAHSMGGLVFKKYIYDFGSVSIGKFIDLATPHLGAPKAAKALLFGDDMGIKYSKIIFVNTNTIKDISQNMMSTYELLPSPKYFVMLSNDYKNYLYNEEYLFNPPYLPQANMSYSDSIFYLGATGRNKNLLPYNQLLHSQIDELTIDNSYNIVGCGQATIGKIWFKGKNKNGKDEYDISYINGDGTVPLQSATYFREPIVRAHAEHSSISSTNGVKQLVASILKGEENNFNFNNYSNLSKTESVCTFNGYQISFHSPIGLNISTTDGRHLGTDADGNIENNIEVASYDILGDNKFAYVPAGVSYTISGQAESAGDFNMRIKKIVDGKYTETTLFYNLRLDSAQSAVKAELSETGVLSALHYDAEGDGVFEKTISPSSVLNSEQQGDVNPPSTSVKVTGEEVATSAFMLAASFQLTTDDGIGSGMLDTYFHLDNTAWQKYSANIDISLIGHHRLEYYSVDKAGNEEETKNNDFQIVEPTSEYLIGKINLLYAQGEIYNLTVKNYFNQQLNAVISRKKEMAVAIASWRAKLAVESAKCAQSKYPALCQGVIKGIESIINSIESAGNSFIKYKYAEMLKTLDIYKSKNWLSQSAYDIIKIRLIYLRDKI
jgi:hypothetical protein